MIVVGLGGMGGATAYHLARQGASVIGIDQLDPPHGAGSSHGESRIIREAYFEDPVYVPLVRRAFQLWGELEEELDCVLFHRTRALMVGAPDSEIISGAEKTAALHNIPIRRFDPDELARTFPAFRLADGAVAVLEQRAGLLHVEACVAAHLVGAEAHGAQLRTNEEVVGWERVSGGVEVRTNRETYSAGHVVFAAGAWMRRFFPQLPLQIERQVMLWFAPAFSPASVTPEHCPVFLFETADGTYYGVPDLGSGVKAARHRGGAVVQGGDAAGAGVGVSEEDVSPVRRFLRSHLPAAAGTLERSSVCRYTNTPDKKFLIDRHPEWEEVTVVSACSGHGFKFASAIGEATADLVANGRRGENIEPFAWRF